MSVAGTSVAGGERAAATDLARFRVVRGEPIAVVLSVLVAACMLAACSGGESATGPGAPQGAVPAALVGRWYNGDVSSTNFYNSGTGSWDNAYGNGLSFTFKADGTFESGYETYASAYGCTSEGFEYQKGTMTVDTDAQVITLYTTGGTAKGIDNCNARFNYEKPVGRQTHRMPYSLAAADDGTPVLVIHFDGGDMPFRPWNQ